MAAGTSISKPCSVYNGFNFKRDIQDRIGHLTKLKIGDTQFDANIEVKNPIDEANVKVVAVLSDWYWDGGDAEPIQIQGQVAIATKQKLQQMLHTGLRNTEVLFQFNVYEYDPSAKKFFKCVHTNDADLAGLIMKSGDSLMLDIADTASSQVPEPENFTLSLSVMPKRQEQDLHIAVSDTGKLVKKWGVTVA